MKRSYLFILLVALILTSGFYLYNRSTRMSTGSGEMQAFLSPVSATDNSKIAVSAEEGMALTAAVGSIAEAPAADLAVAGQVVPAGMQRKVIGRAAIELVVADAEAVVAQINQLMDTIGGYVANANLSRNNYNGAERLQGTLNLRIPTDQLDATLAQLEAMGIEARSKSINREDVTDQYTDIDAQLRNLKATENELRELLAEVRAKPNATPEDILIVHRSMTDIRSQIEQLQGRKNMLDNLIGMSTIDVTLTPELIMSQPVIEAGWRPVAVARSALRDLVGALQGFADAGIWLVLYFIPVVLMLCIPVAIVYFLARALMARWQRRSAASGAGD